MPGLDIAEQRAWQNFLDAALRLYGTLNRALVDEHKLTLVDVRLLEILDKSETGSARMGDLAEQLHVAAESGDPPDPPAGGGRTGAARGQPRRRPRGAGQHHRPGPRRRRARRW